MTITIPVWLLWLIGIPVGLAGIVCAMVGLYFIIMMLLEKL